MEATGICQHASEHAKKKERITLYAKDSRFDSYSYHDSGRRMTLHVMGAFAFSLCLVM